MVAYKRWSLAGGGRLLKVVPMHGHLRGVVRVLA
jgi:hypothetical protein